jgi:phosphoribosylamine--glycine ligase
MKILVIGGGGREHAIIRKLRESPRAGEVLCAPGNGGISREAECVPVPVGDIPAVVRFAKENRVNFVFVAPDDPLAAGMVDALEAADIPAFGPVAKAAEIESSKVFSKGLMKKYGIPTADYAVFSDPRSVLDYVRARGKYPAVIKADGLALGKGVIIAADYPEAEQAVKIIMEDRKFGASGNRVVVEEFLTGPEVSVLAFTDGKSLKPMVSSKDHKRALDGDRGLNTGGMGTISPNPYYTPEIAADCMEKIFLPTVRAMNAEGRPFRGCLYFGLMLTPDGPKVIEYNSRFGDPETQVVLPRLKTDFVDVIEAVAEGRLAEQPVEWSSDACACVVMASGGYPEQYRRGLEITGLDADGQLPGVTVYHAGTVWKNGKFYTNGGRVLGVTAMGKNLPEALAKAYGGVSQIQFDGAFYRRDIGR